MSSGREALKEVLAELIDIVGEAEARDIWREVSARHAATGGADVSEYMRTLADVLSRRTGVPLPPLPTIH